MSGAWRLLAAALALGWPTCGIAQEMPQIGDLSAARPAKGPERVHYTSEAERVVAHEGDALTLHFRVDDGFHINSHRPNGDLLIATELRVQATDGVKMGAAEYPVGRPFHFEVSSRETLDVYSGAFDVLLPVTAKAGTYTLHGTLRYQACDKAACYPVRSLPVDVVFTSR